MQLTEHFSLEELTVSAVATRLGMSNTPSPGIVDNLHGLALELEEYRARLGHPIIILSGYRSPGLNLAVKGSRHSAHMVGLAADLICPGFGSPLAVARLIAEAGRLYDQVIYEGKWCHLGIAPPRAGSRLEQLTARFSEGSVTYEPGLNA